MSVNFLKKEKKHNEKFYNIKIKEYIKHKVVIKSMEYHNNSSTKVNNIMQVNKINTERSNKHNNSYLNNSIEDYNTELLTKKFDYFDIGFILIYTAIGGMEIINFTEFTCTHDSEGEGNGIDSPKNNSVLNPSQCCCCLYHCIEKTEKKLDTKLKITNFINNKRFSQEFIDFICLCTSYDLLERNVTFSKLKNHSWLNMKNDCVPNIFEFNDLYATYSNNKKNLYEKNVDNLIDVIARTCPSTSSTYYKDNNFHDASYILSKENKDDDAFNYNKKRERLINPLSASEEEDYSKSSKKQKVSTESIIIDLTDD